MPDTTARHTWVKALGGDLMLIITSNSYKDREDEYISTAALSDYVESAWDGDTFIGDNVLLYHHRGPVIGYIVWADMQGPFLVEVARKRRSRLPAIQKYIDTIWSWVKHSPAGWGASHGFRYRKADRDSAATYHRILKKETSVLRRLLAANPYTYAEVVTP